MVASVLERLETHVARTRPDFLAILLPGVSDDALNTFEARFSLRLPDNFRQLYRWRNGQPPDCSANFDHNRMFTPLEEVADTKAMLDGMIGEEFDDPRWWRRTWVPFLSNGGGDHLCLDVLAEDGGSPGQLIAFWHDLERRSVEHPSIEAWLSSLV
jgi:cell wall assembly regulator SMI1